MFKKIAVFALLVVLAAATVLPAAAGVTDSYTRADVPGAIEVNVTREMYAAVQEMNAASLGLTSSLEGITDIFRQPNGEILLLCGGTSRLISIRSDYSAAREIPVTDGEGAVDFEGAGGVYADGEGNLYIADTNHERILICSADGVVQQTLGSPQSSLIPEDFLFHPIAIEKDTEGYTYILSLGCYYGALMYSPEYEFMGFYGSNTVEASALDTLSYLWKRLTSTDAKKAASVKTLPYSFTDFCFDTEDFMITVTGAISSDKYSSQGTVGQLRKISHNGDNILYKRKLDGDSVTSSTVNFLETSKPEGAAVQDLTSVAVSDDGFIYVLDGGNGTVYIYDTDCNLLSAFGGGYGQGNQLGVFRKATALALNGRDVLVADQDSYTVTVFRMTDYGDKLFQAQGLYLDGDYAQAKNLWQEVLSLNRNCHPAYKGLAMAYYNEGDYRAALEAARTGMDYSVYDLAWQELVSQFIADHFVWILLLIVAVIGAVVGLWLWLRRRKKRLITNQRLQLMLRVPFHPFDSYDEMKYKKLGSVKAAMGITVLFYAAAVLNVIGAGFLYTDTLLRNYNSLYTLGSTAGLLVLWSVCNWLVCSMFSGKGTLREVYTATAYALVPWVLFQLVRVLLTRFLPLSTSGLIGALTTVMLLYTFFLVAVATMKMHEYDFFQFLLTGLVTIFFMILVVFILFLCAILISQFFTFLVSVYEEVAYR